MYKIKLFFLLLLPAALNGVEGHAQEVRPIKLQFESIDLTSADQVEINNGNINEADLIITASCEPEWALYAMEFHDNVTAPSVFIFHNSAHFDLVGNITAHANGKPYDSALQIYFKWSEGVVKFRQRVRLNSPAAIIKGTVTFGVRNDLVLHQLESVNFNIAVNLKNFSSKGATKESEMLAASLNENLEVAVTDSRDSTGWMLIGGIFFCALAAFIVFLVLKHFRARKHLKQSPP